MIAFKRLDHLLICIPPGCKLQAQKFYAETLGLKEMIGEHPRGALWFEIADIQLHIREEAGPQINSDRHPAFEVKALSAAREFLERQNIPVSYSSEIEGRERCFFHDPFGNRFELIEYKKETS